MIQERGTLLDLAWYLLNGDCIFVFGPRRAHDCSVFEHGKFLSILCILLIRGAEISYLQYHTPQQTQRLFLDRSSQKQPVKGDIKLHYSYVMQGLQQS